MEEAERKRMLVSMPLPPKTPPPDAARPVPGVPLPETTELGAELLYGLDDDVPSVALMREHFAREGRITRCAALRIARQARSVLEAEPNLLRLASPIHVVGDIHGQYYDLLAILEKVGMPSDDNAFLFLGDYVDRGAWSSEVALLLLACKICFPDSVHLLRGNHESRLFASVMTFAPECERKYGREVYEALQDAFVALPLAAVLSTHFGRVFCVHGGIGPFLDTLSDIDLLDRFTEIPESGLIADLLWSDPDADHHPGHGHDNGDDCSTASDSDDDHGQWESRSFNINTGRKISYYYGQVPVRRFLAHNSLICMIRGHEAQQHGFKAHWQAPGAALAPVITLFSCPNYCDEYGNCGAFVSIADREFKICQMNAAPHPTVLPNCIDGFSWSVGLVTEYVVDLLKGLVHDMATRPYETEEERKADRELEEKSHMFWSKARRLRENREQFRRSLLSSYHEGNLSLFEKMLIVDRDNEAFPAKAPLNGSAPF